MKNALSVGIWVAALGAAALSGACDMGAECTCAGAGVSLLVRDATGAAIAPDAVGYSVDGEPFDYPGEQLCDCEILIGGSRAGTYRLWVTVDGQEWESGDIDVQMGGPEGCRRPETVDVTVTFDPAGATAETEVVGHGCA